MCGIIVKKKKIQSSNGVTAKKNGSYIQQQSHFFTFPETPPGRVFFLRFVPLCACVRSYIYFRNSSFIYTQLSVYVLPIYVYKLYVYMAKAVDDSFQKICARPICSSHYYVFLCYITYTLQFVIKLFFTIWFFILVFFSSLHNYMSKNKYINKSSTKDCTIERMKYKLNIGTTIF